MPSRPGKIGPAHVEHLGPLRLPPADPQNMLRQIRRVVFGSQQTAMRQIRTESH
jgi:hypothetical protein